MKSYVWTGNPGYSIDLDDRTITPEPGVPFELSDDEAKSLGDDVKPAGKAKAEPKTDEKGA